MNKIALTIASSDPTGSAGLQVDLKVFNRFNVYGLSAVAAITAQNTYEVKAIKEVDAVFFEEQLEVILSDIRPDALKAGMLFSADAIRVAAKIIKGFDLQNLVIDPVTVSSTGIMLIEEKAIDELKKELFPLAKVITPNIYEASVFSKVNIEGEKDIKTAAIELRKLGPEVVIITGGHLEEVRGKTADDTFDIVYDGKKFYRIIGKRIKGEYHGTGCAFSAALTACIAKGLSVAEAAKKAKEFVEHAIKNSLDIGKGMRLLNI